MSENTPAPNFQTSVILWAAMLMSCLIYVVIAFVLEKPEGFELEKEQFNLFLMVFGAMAPGMAIPAFLARGFLIKQNLSNKSEPVTESDVVAAYHTGSIVGWAFTESISIFGFVIFMLSYERWVLAPFVGLSVLLFLLTFPRKSQIADYMKEYGSSASSTPDQPTGSSW